MPFRPPVSAPRSGARPRVAIRLAGLLGGWLLLAIAGPAFACTTDAECSDGLVCNGSETCNTGSNLCEPGSPAPDGTGCNLGSGVTCTLIDTCSAGVCTAGGGGDTDGDLVCEAEDNCPGVANASQADLDEDSDGDACDASDRALNIVFARIKRNSSTNPLKPSGRVFLRGDFLTTAPEAAFTQATGFLVRIRDRFAVEGTPGFPGLDRTLTWGPGLCQTNSRSGRIKCVTADKLGRIVMSPISGGGGAYKWQVEFRKLALTGPFDMPVEASLVTGPGAPPTLVAGIDRVGLITDCKQINFGLTCRE